MNNIEIIDLSSTVLSGIVENINESIYSEIDGSLSLKWSENLNAQALSKSDLSNPPEHVITIGYDFLIKIYDVISQYCHFVESNEERDLFVEIFKDDPQIFDLIPQGYSTDQVRNNMFLGAVTWVFFHELTHLIQEHGIVRAGQIDIVGSIINELDISADEHGLTGRQSAVFHLTELSADHGATLMCLAEVMLHAEIEEHDLENLLQLIVAGIACVMYQFNTKKSMELENEPIGTHPHPLVRLEHTIPAFQEWLYSPNTQERDNFVYKVNQVTTSVTVFWLKHIWIYPNLLEYTPFLAGTVNRPTGKEYLQKLIEVWDEIRPDIEKNRRYGDPTGIDLLNFTEEYRQLVYGR